MEKYSFQFLYGVFCECIVDFFPTLRVDAEQYVPGQEDFLGHDFLDVFHVDQIVSADS